MRYSTFGYLFSVTLSLAWGQTGASIVNLSYQAPRELLVAPGQVVNLTLRGLTTAFGATYIVPTLPLATNLSGLSVSLQQTGGTPELIPLLRAAGGGSVTCNGSGTAAFMPPGNRVSCTPGDVQSDFLVQIPFDLKPNPPLGPCPGLPCGLIPGLNDAVLTVSESSGAGGSLRVMPVVDQIHVLNTCTDAVGEVQAALVGLYGSIYISLPCSYVVTHADGTFVTLRNPAKSREELVLYALGLGAPDALFPTVSGTPAGGVPISRPFMITFAGLPGSSVPADYAGLVEKSAGLYQINFRMPAVSAGLPACSAQVPSNMTITVVGTASSDQASFCAQAQ